MTPLLLIQSCTWYCINGVYETHATSYISGESRKTWGVLLDCDIEFSHLIRDAKHCKPTNLVWRKVWPKIEEGLVVKNNILYCWHRFRK